eukprot:581454-Prymnesium_polylepis.1
MADASGVNRHGLVGTKLQWTVESGGERGGRCARRMLPFGSKCIPDATRMQLANLTAWSSPGLGLAKSGGAAINFALASCKTVDLFGSGMYSDGPGYDVVYGHWYMERFPKGCRHACVPQDFFKTTVEGRRSGGKLSSGHYYGTHSKALCRPQTLCDGPRSGLLERSLNPSGHEASKNVPQEQNTE